MEKDLKYQFVPQYSKEKLKILEIQVRYSVICIRVHREGEGGDDPPPLAFLVPTLYPP